MKATKLILGLTAVSIFASSAGAQLVTDGLVSYHTATAGWDGSTWTDQVSGDGYDPAGSLVGDVTHVSGPIPHFKIDDAGPSSDPPVDPAPNNKIVFDDNLTQFGTSDFTYQIVMSNTPEQAYLNTHSGVIGARTGVTNVSDNCCSTEGFGIWLVRTGDRLIPGSFLSHVQHFNVRPRTPTVQYMQGPNQIPGSDGLDVEDGDAFFDGTFKTLTMVRQAHEVHMFYGVDEAGIAVERLGDHDGSQSFPPPKQGAVDMGGGRVDIIDSSLDIGVGFASEGDGLPGAQIHAALFYNRALSAAEIGQNSLYFPIPEPASLALLTVGGLLMLKQRR